VPIKISYINESITFYSKAYKHGYQLDNKWKQIIQQKANMLWNMLKQAVKQ
jgi:hypothetical protein